MQVAGNWSSIELPVINGLSNCLMYCKLTQLCIFVCFVVWKYKLENNMSIFDSFNYTEVK